MKDGNPGASYGSLMLEAQAPSQTRQEVSDANTCRVPKMKSADNAAADGYGYEDVECSGPDYLYAAREPAITRLCHRVA